MEERIVELEVRVAYQEKLLSDLDEVVRELASRVELQARELEKVKALLEEDPQAVGAADEKPPHW